MKQDIRMAAILERDGRVFLVRERPDAAWELPGGPLPLDNDDIDAEMDAVLQRLGVMAPAIEEDFLATHYFPAEDGQVVYNVYAATEWTGDPSARAGVGTGWFALAEIESIRMDEHARGAVLEAFGLREPVDRMQEIMAALADSSGGGPADLPHPLPPLPRRERGDAAGVEAGARHGRRDAGLDVLRTLRGGGDPGEAAAGLERTSPEIAGDVIDFALGEVWSDGALDRKTRSLQVVAMLAAMGRTGGPLASHINGALNHGATVEQVIQTLRMVAVYAGFPAALEAWPVMEKVFEQRGIPRPGRPQ
jgi:4-carboxymuconolactone decarboxylase